MVDPATKVTNSFSLRNPLTVRTFPGLCPHLGVPYPLMSFLVVMASVTATTAPYGLVIVPFTQRVMWETSGLYPCYTRVD